MYTYINITYIVPHPRFPLNSVRIGHTFPPSSSLRMKITTGFKVKRTIVIII